ncbi:MAG: TadE family protein [Pirellulaceae bacterium]|nr:TadE family protein [Pirellulaceae bacterium]
MKKQGTRVRNRHRKAPIRMGAAMIEFAIVAPLMILFTLGIIEMGRMTMVKQVLTNISREGARMATLPDATNTTVQTQIEQLLTGSKITGATVALNPSSISSAPSGSLVTVTIAVTAENVSWLNTPLFMGGKSLTASTSMRRESL